MEKKDFENNLGKKKEEMHLKVDPKQTSQPISEQLEWEEGMYRNRTWIIYLKEGEK